MHSIPFSSLRRLFSSSSDLSSLSKILPIGQSHTNIYKRLQHYSTLYTDMSNTVQSSSPGANPISPTKPLDVDMLSIRHNHFVQYTELIEDASGLIEVMGDESMKDLVAEELEALHQRLKQITDDAIACLVPKDKYDECSVCVLEYRPGVGGAEAMIFAQEMYEAIRIYCENKGWRIEDLNYNKDTIVGKGIKSAIMKVTGPNSYNCLKCESGVHK